MTKPLSAACEQNLIVSLPSSDSCCTVDRACAISIASPRASRRPVTSSAWPATALAICRCCRPSFRTSSRRSSASNTLVAPVQRKPMPVILRTPDDVDVWLAAEAMALQGAPPDGALRIVAKGIARTAPPSGCSGSPLGARPSRTTRRAQWISSRRRCQHRITNKVGEWWLSDALTAVHAWRNEKFRRRRDERGDFVPSIPGEPLHETTMLLATESAICSLVMTPATSSGRDPPMSRTTIATSARLRCIRRTTLNNTSRSRTMTKFRPANSRSWRQCRWRPPTPETSRPPRRDG